MVSRPLSERTRSGAGVQQHEAARAVGVLGVAGVEARLAEHGGLLVAEDAGDGNTLEWPGGVAITPTDGTIPEQHRHGHADGLATARRSHAQGLEIHQHGPGLHWSRR